MKSLKASVILGDSPPNLTFIREVRDGDLKLRSFRKIAHARDNGIFRIDDRKPCSIVVV